MSKFDLTGGLIRKDMGKKGRSAAQDPASEIGRNMIAAVMNDTGLSYGEAAQQLLSGGMPSGVEAISANAARQLTEMVKNGQLTEDFAEYLNDPDFITLLSEMPAASAVRLYEAELEKRELKDSAGRERQLGEQDTLEKLINRRGLPQSTRVKAPAQTELDFHTMSPEEFAHLRSRMKQGSAR